MSMQQARNNGMQNSKRNRDEDETSVPKGSGVEQQGASPPSIQAPSTDEESSLRECVACHGEIGVISESCCGNFCSGVFCGTCAALEGCKACEDLFCVDCARGDCDLGRGAGCGWKVCKRCWTAHPCEWRKWRDDRDRLGGCKECIKNYKCPSDCVCNEFECVDCGNKIGPNEQFSGLKLTIETSDLDSAVECCGQVPIRGPGNHLGQQQFKDCTGVFCKDCVKDNPCDHCEKPVCEKCNQTDGGRVCFKCLIGMDNK